MIWKLAPTGNYIADGDGFFVSYRPTNTGPLGGTIADCDTDEGETAIVKQREYYILNGDHREAYGPLITDGFDACKAYFDAHPDLVSSWSN